jgi:hypothetical protein
LIQRRRRLGPAERLTCNGQPGEEVDGESNGQDSLEDDGGNYKLVAPEDSQEDIGRFYDTLDSTLHISSDASVSCKRLRDTGDESDSDEDKVNVKAVNSDDSKVQTKRWNRRLAKTLGFEVSQAHVDTADTIWSFLLCRAKHQTTQSFFECQFTWFGQPK